MHGLLALCGTTFARFVLGLVCAAHWIRTVLMRTDTWTACAPCTGVGQDYW